MYDFELDAIRIGEEYRIVTRYIVVLTRRIKNTPAVRFDLLCQGINLRSAFTTEGNFAQADSVFIEGVRGEARIRLFDPEAPGRGRPPFGAVEVVKTCRVADLLLPSA